MLFSASMPALASRSRSTTESWPHAAAKCSGVRPRELQGPRPSPQAPTEPRGEKLGENVGASKVKVLEIVDTQMPLENCGFKMS